MNKRRTVLFLHRKLLSPLKEFISDSRSVGIILIITTLASIIIANSAWGDSYNHFWEMPLQMPAPELHLPHTPLHIINDFLMAFFFLLVGLEIKRELLVGELASLKKSLLPIIAAVGGMVVPMFIFFLWCGNSSYKNGWGIPMATDIAFSLGVLSLLGKRIPVSFKVFLTALAIIDDLGGILMIAVFYAKEMHWMYLFFAFVIVFLLAMMNLFKVRRHYFYFILGILLWYLIYNSGVHATVAGVLLAFTIPLYKIEQLEHSLHDPVNFIILPLFALANTAILLPADWSPLFSSSLHHGIFTGLVIGKPLGIFIFSFLAIKLKLAEPARKIDNKGLLGIGLIAGIGFTMSIFMSSLAFENPASQLIAKVAIIGASFVAGSVGYIYLRVLMKT